MDFSKFSVDLSKLQASLASTDLTMATTATILHWLRQGRRVAAVAAEMTASVKTSGSGGGGNGGGIIG